MSVSSSKINIVFLTDCLADLTGGAERQIFELANRLDKKTYSVTIASLECEGEAPRTTYIPAVNRPLIEQVESIVIRELR